jgi:hypothetical protein
MPAKRRTSKGRAFIVTDRLLELYGRATALEAADLALCLTPPT